MIPIDQTIFGKTGNCFPACVASILQLKLSEVPDWCTTEGDNWFLAFRKWCQETRGLYPVMLLLDEKTSVKDLFPGFTLIGGNGPRGLKHEVIYLHGKLFHDPHPSRAGLETIEDMILFVSFNPLW